SRQPRSCEEGSVGPAQPTRRGRERATTFSFRFLRPPQEDQHGPSPEAAATGDLTSKTGPRQGTPVERAGLALVARQDQGSPGSVEGGAGRSALYHSCRITVIASASLAHLRQRIPDLGVVRAGGSRAGVQLRDPQLRVRSHDRGELKRVPLD